MLFTVNERFKFLTAIMQVLVNTFVCLCTVKKIGDDLKEVKTN